MKAGLFTQYILVLAGAAYFRADSAAAWVEVHGHQSDSPAQCSVVYYNFDECFNVLVLLDLTDRVRAQFFMGGALIAAGINMVPCQAYRNRAMAAPISVKANGFA